VVIGEHLLISEGFFSKCMSRTLILYDEPSGD